MFTPENLTVSFEPTAHARPFEGNLFYKSHPMARADGILMTKGEVESAGGSVAVIQKFTDETSSFAKDYDVKTRVLPNGNVEAMALPKGGKKNLVPGSQKLDPIAVSLGLERQG